jgi:hypothetical protein
VGTLVLALGATGPPHPSARAQVPHPTVEVSVGRWSVLNEGSGATGVGAEYRFKPFRHPGVAVSAGATWAESGAAYVFGCLGYDFRLGGTWVLTPTFAAGLFEEGGDLQLGHAVEFRTGLRLGRRVGRYQVALQVSHLSNAGLAESNLGSEVVELAIGIPAGRRPAQSVASASASAGTEPDAASSSRRISSPASAR